MKYRRDGDSKYKPGDYVRIRHDATDFHEHWRGRVALVMCVPGTSRLLQLQPAGYSRTIAFADSDDGLDPTTEEDYLVAVLASVS